MLTPAPACASCAQWKADYRTVNDALCKAQDTIQAKDQEIAGLNLQLDAWRAAYGRVAHGRP